jgi:hypothetical protein
MLVVAVSAGDGQQRVRVPLECAHASWRVVRVVARGVPIGRCKTGMSSVWAIAGVGSTAHTQVARIEHRHQSHRREPSTPAVTQVCNRRAHDQHLQPPCQKSGCFSAASCTHQLRIVATIAVKRRHPPTSFWNHQPRHNDSLRLKRHAAHAIIALIGASIHYGDWLGVALSQRGTIACAHALDGVARKTAGGGRPLTQQPPARQCQCPTEGVRLVIGSGGSSSGSSRATGSAQHSTRIPAAAAAAAAAAVAAHTRPFRRRLRPRQRSSVAAA